MLYMKTIATILIYIAGAVMLGIILFGLSLIITSRSEKDFIIAVFGGLAIATLVARVVFVFKDSFFPKQNKTYKPRK